MGNQSPAAIAALALSVVALIICIVSMATEYWAKISGEGYSAHTGLIKQCGCFAGQCQCETILTKKEAADWFKASFACICLAVVCNLAAVVTTALIIFHAGTDSLLGFFRKVAVGALALAAIWNIIAVIVFAAKYKDDSDILPDATFKLGWSWGLAILSFVLDIICAVVVVLVKRTDS